MILADKIIDLRKKNGWSQEELAEKLGVSRQAVSKWESAQAIPDLGRVLAMADLFSVTTDYLLRDETKRELEGFTYRDIALFRTETPREIAYAAVSAWHLCSWYRDTKFCGRCGASMEHDEKERMMHCHNMLERGLSLGMEATDLWFDPLFLVVKGMQDKQMDVLNAIKLFSDEGLKSTGGLSNNSNGAPKNVRPIMDSALVAMAMMQGLTSAIVNPNDLRLMETIKSCDIFKNHELYSDSYLDA